jgi:hypothetical protein
LIAFIFFLPFGFCFDFYFVGQVVVPFVWLLMPDACQQNKMTINQDDGFSEGLGMAFSPARLAGRIVILAEQGEYNVAC